MNDQGTGSRIKKTLGFTACIVVLTYVVVAITLITLPAKIVNSNPVSSNLRSLMVVGPFFYESQLHVSFRFATRIYSNGRWSIFRDARMENTRKFHQMPWRYDLLKIGEFEEYAARQIASSRKSDFNSVKSSKPFRELNEFIVRQHPEDKVDSISMVYIRRFYLPESDGFAVDTVFAYTYHTYEVAHSK